MLTIRNILKITSLISVLWVVVTLGAFAQAPGRGGLRMSLPSERNVDSLSTATRFSVSWCGGIVGQL
jgi:hypothetical protein